MLPDTPSQEQFQEIYTSRLAAVSVLVSADSTDGAKHPIHYRIASRLKISPRFSDLLIWANQVFLAAHESIKAYRVAGCPSRVRKNHVTGFLIAIRLLTNRLTYDNCLGLLAKVHCVDHRG
jgi:hypothetical protein